MYKILLLIILAALIFGGTACSNTEIIDDIKSKSKVILSFIKPEFPTEEIGTDNLASAKEFCPKIDNCFAYETNLLNLFIDTCQNVDLSEWKVNTGEKVYYLELGELDSRRYAPCFLERDVGQNINNYYCNISLTKEFIIDDGGTIIAKNFHKYIGVEYMVESTKDSGLMLLKLVDYSCT